MAEYWPRGRESGMWLSRLFWRLFLTYAVLTVASSVTFAWIFLAHQREVIESEIRNRLRDEAATVRQFADAAWEAPQAPLEELRGAWQPKLESLGRGLGTRVTLVLSNGTVLADSATNAGHLENHADRPEIEQAH